MKKDLSSAKERVKEALKREQEERNGPRKRRLVRLCLLFILRCVCIRDVYLNLVRRIERQNYQCTILEQRCIFLLILALKGAKIFLNVWQKDYDHRFCLKICLMK